MKEKIKRITKIKRTKLYLKVISMILVFTTLTTPIQLDAQTLDYTKGNTLINNNSDLYFIKELEELRTENSKTFLRSDGTNVMTVTSDEIHYFDSETKKWKDIDNTLEEKKLPDGSTVLTNKDNDFNVELPARLNSRNSKISIESGGYKIFFKLINEGIRTSNLTRSKSKARRSASINEKSPIEKNINSDSILKSELPQKDVSVLPDRTLTQDQAAYTEILANTNIQYEIKGSSLKENIILTKKPTNRISYKYEISVEGLTAQLKETKEVLFYGKDKEKTVFIMPAPYMFDEKSFSGDITVSLSKEVNGKYILIYTPSYEWLSSTQRVYPVTVDPTVTRNSGIQDISVSPSGTRSSVSNELTAGKDSAGAHDIYIKTSNISLPKDSVLTKATVNLNLNRWNPDPNSSDYTIRLASKRISSDWSETGGSDKPAVTGEYTDCVEIGPENHNKKYYSWDITGLFKGWTEGTFPNYGVNISPVYYLTAAKYYYFSSKESSDSNTRPYFEIEYKSSRGISSKTGDRQIDAGEAGTIYVNDYTGQMTVQRQDIGYDGNVLPVSIGMTYNMAERNNSQLFGSGYNINYNQRLETVVSQHDHRHYYVFYESDGTPIYLKTDEDETSKQYKDEEGLGYTMEYSGAEPSGGSYHTATVTDPNGRKYYFESSQGYIVKIEENNPAKSSVDITRSVSSDSKKIDTICDGAKRKYSLHYTSDKLQYIYYYGHNSSYLSYTYYTYNTSGMLTSYRTAAGKTINYEYYNTTNKLLKKITLPDGMTYNFEYTTYPANDTAPTKISRIVIKGTDGTTTGQDVSISYSGNSTKYTDNLTGNIEISQYDNYGNLTNVQDGKGNASAAKYENSNPNNYNSDQIVYVSELQNPVKNIIRNGSAEQSASYWYSSGSINRVSNEKYFGNYSFYISAGGLYHYFPESLDSSKTYTFSAYVKFSYATSAGYAEISIGSGDGKFNIGEKMKTTTGGWQRIEHTFTGVNASTLDITYNGYGDFYMDGIQLEEKGHANQYNLIENGDFENSYNYWISNGGGMYPLTPTSNKSPSGGAVLDYWAGYKDSSTYQTYTADGKKDDVYDLGGWAKAHGALEENDQRKFELTAIFYKNGSKVGEEQSVKFNYHVTDWQYTLGQVRAQEDYDKIEIHIKYTYQLNFAWFDCIQLFKNANGINLHYDNQGNLLYGEDVDITQNEEETADLDNPDLSDPTSSKSKSEADQYNRIIESISDAGVGETYNYDKYNNVLVSRITNGRLSIKKEYSYTDTGNYILSISDERGNTINYNYDKNTGVLLSQTDAKGNVINYSYSANTAFITKVYSNISGLYNGSPQMYTEFEYDTGSRLKHLYHNGFNYTFNYDALGTLKSTCVGGTNSSYKLFEYNYALNNNSLLNGISFGNGQTVNYEYDNSDNLKSIKFGTQERFRFYYDSKGNISCAVDILNNLKIEYFSDSNGNNIISEISTGNGTYRHNYFIDDKGLNETIDGLLRITEYIEDMDSRNNGIKYSPRTGVNTAQEIFYDDLGRKEEEILYRKENGTEKTLLQTQFTYPKYSGYKTTQLVSNMNITALIIITTKPDSLYELTTRTEELQYISMTQEEISVM